MLIIETIQQYTQGDFFYLDITAVERRLSVCQNFMEYHKVSIRCKGDFSAKAKNDWHYNYAAEPTIVGEIPIGVPLKDKDLEIIEGEYKVGEALEILAPEVYEKYVLE